MAKNNKETTRTSIDDLNDSLSSVEQKIEGNKKIITWTILGIVILAGLILGYYYGIYRPSVENAKTAISKADMQAMMGNDSIALAEYLNVAKEYSSAPANRASLEAGIRLYKAGKYTEAIEQLKDYKVSESLVGAASQSLIGDCYVNLKNYNEALSYFDKAIKISDDNSLYTPLFMMKKATVYRELKDYKAEKEIYSTISTKYPDFSMAYQTDIQKYLERAEAQLGE